MAGENINKPIIKVKHAELTRTGDSAFRSECPTCKEGVLLVMRNQETFELEKLDRCMLCGQQFEYTDLDSIMSGGS